MNDHDSFARYQQLASRTSAPDRSERERLINAALGLAGEAGEVVDTLKKHLTHGHPLHREKLVDEAGDVLWYLAELATVLGVSLAEMAAANIRKLERRYPQGFSTEASMARSSTEAQP
jgi:NTP pyrophosphatase (non-canonical NTP hydrolase)